MAQGKSGKQGAGVEVKTTIHPEALHLADHLIKVAHGDNSGDSAPVADVMVAVIPIANEAAGVLAAFVHPSHIAIYAPRDSLPCRLPASSLNLGNYPVNLDKHHASASLPLQCRHRVMAPQTLYLGDAPLLACTPGVQVGY
ncbi:hypothetical protein C9426_27145 [Serratia sp. S1B]|nr:hypothetical protein C9426_27145 [Serratia sp. S1B]